MGILTKLAKKRLHDDAIWMQVLGFFVFVEAHATFDRELPCEYACVHVC